MKMQGIGLCVLSVLCGRYGRSRSDGFRTVLHFMLIFAALAAGIVVAGYGYWRNQERHYRAKAEQELAAIAELKMGELVQWRLERLGLVEWRDEAGFLQWRIVGKPEATT